MGLFENLGNLLGQAMDPSRQYGPPLDELRRLWAKNPVAAVLHARLRWQEIPEHLAQRAAELMQAQQDSAAMRSELNTSYQAMGLSPDNSSIGGPNPEELLFMSTMGAVRQSKGEASSGPAGGHAQLAEAVLMGRVSSRDAMMQLLPPEARQLAPLFGMIPEVSANLERTMAIQCAVMVPSSRIPAVLAVVGS